MAKMDWSKANRYSRDGSSSIKGDLSARRFPADYAGRCGVCGVEYPIGTFITRDKFTGGYIHTSCKKAPIDKSRMRVVKTPDSRKFGNCLATTKAGKPCQNKRQRGHKLCGPHLDMR